MRARQVRDVGEQKLKDFAEPFVAEITEYLRTNSRQAFREVLAPMRRRSALNDSEAETLGRFHRGDSVDEIARARGFVPSTIYGHLVTAIEFGNLAERARFFTATQEKEIAAAFQQVSDGKLVDVSALLDNKYDIGLLRIFRALGTREP